MTLRTIPILALGAILVAASCSSKKSNPSSRSTPPEDTESAVSEAPPTLPRIVEPRELAAHLIYLLTRDEVLYSFDPSVRGVSAYRQVAKPDCKQSDRPQSMAIDRQGNAWVIHHSGLLFHIDLRDGACAPLPIRGASSGQYGMAFTSLAPGSNDEELYLNLSDVSLFALDKGANAVRDLQFGQRGELTGGGDAKLFLFDPIDRVISEIDLAKKSFRRLHTLTSMPPSFGAYAFARYAGAFFLFTSLRRGVPSRTTVYDPVRQTEVVRDADIGIEVVGAGQSTLTPTSDTKGMISGTAPDEDESPHPQVRVPVPESL